MKFIPESELANFETLEQDVPKLVYFKLIAIGTNTLNKFNRKTKDLLNLIHSIEGNVCLPKSKEDLKGEVCQMIDEIYEE